MQTGQWADIIKDCKKSGLKVDGYCVQHGLSGNVYVYRFRKVKELSEEQTFLDMDFFHIWQGRID